MRRIYLIILCAGILFPCESNAQGFLKKLKQKAENAVGKAVGMDITGENSNEDYSENSGNKKSTVSGTDLMPPRRTNIFSWSEPTNISSSASPTQLLGELPPVPSAADLANPSEEKQGAFYSAIKAVTLRAEQLNEENTCSDDEVMAFRKKTNNMAARALKKMFGLSDSEINVVLEPDKHSEAEQKTVQEKIKKGVTDGLAGDDMDDVQAIAKKYEGMSDEEIAANMTPGDMAKMRSMMGNIHKQQKKISEGMAEIQQYQMNFVAYYNKIMPMIEITETDDSKYIGYVKSQYEKINALKKKIYSVNDAAAYNPLFAEAEEMISKSRENVASKWAADIAQKVNHVKKNMPALVQAQKQAAKNGIIPECGIYRQPLNLVIRTGDLLANAYMDFPRCYPEMYITETVDNICSSGNGASGSSSAGCTLFYPEVVSDIQESDNPYKALNLFKTENGITYQYTDKNKWTKCNAINAKSYKPETGEVKDRVILSQDGKRKAVYNAAGRMLQLPEGDIVFPVALSVTKNAITWYTMEQDGGCITVSKCTYKL